MTTCLNCDNKFEGEFCNLCGQESSTHRFTISEWGKEIPHKFLNIEKGLFGTIRALFLRPGISIRDYLKGKRKLLISPFVYVVVMCGIYIVLSSLRAQNTILGLNESQTVTGETRQLVEYIQKQYYKIIIVAMIFPMTLGSFIAYIKSNYNFAEHLVLNAYLIGQLVIGDIILILLASVIAPETNEVIYAPLDVLLKYPYWFWFYYNFFMPSKWYLGISQFVISMIILSVALTGMLYGAALILSIFQG